MLIPSHYQITLTDIETGSPARESGLRRGDAIRDLDRKAVRNMEDFKKITEFLKGDILIRVDRGYIIIKEK